MDQEAVWKMFIETGAPELYLWFNHIRKAEKPNVYEGHGPCHTCNEVQ